MSVFFLLIVAAACARTPANPPAPIVTPTPQAVSDVQPTLLPINTPTSIPSPRAPTPIPSKTPTGTPSPTPTGTATATATNTPLPTDTPTITLTPTPEPPPWPILSWLWDPANFAPATPPAPLPPLPPLAISPGSPSPYLTQFRLVAFYGSPEGRGLGILGNQYRNETVRMLRGVIAEYQPWVTDGRYSIPTFHMITTVAKSCSAYPLCSRQIDKSLIYDWLVTAERNNAAVVLDLQIGRANLMDEFERVREFLYYPHVHLAVDPEFAMNDEQEPGIQLGTLDAADINQLQAEMEKIALEMGVNRVLIVHQFKDSMFTNKQDIINYPHVELVIDGDGYGPPGPKIRNYLQYASEPGFEYGGFKMFTDQANGQLIYDVPFMLPERVMTVLVPQPVVLIFQ
ncbi:MAG: hypothetical protein H6650_02155 [Ardenticatenales bacterium]|nr:hypothetical protein [Ardenticatenales bacterium]